MPLDSSWTPAALAVLERACARHGGWERWRSLERIDLELDSLSGLLPWMKGLGRTFSAFRHGTVEPHNRRTTFHDYPGHGAESVFDNGDMRIESRNAGIAPSAHPRYRETFRGLGKYRRWLPIDAAYFFGYALWHYHSLPFSLVDGHLLAHRSRQGPARNWDALRIEFARDLPTHCRVQTFYFDPTGLLVRHDYVAEIISRTARGAHYWEDHRLTNGYLVAMHRQVVGRLGDWALPITVLEARFQQVEVE